MPGALLSHSTDPSVTIFLKLILIRFDPNGLTLKSTEHRLLLKTGLGDFKAGLAGNC
jgi:hypothetical protein